MEWEQDSFNKNSKKLQAEKSGTPKTSDSLITLSSKDTVSWSKVPIENGSAELNSDAIHLGLLVEKGLIEYDMLEPTIDDDDMGDQQRPITQTIGFRAIAEIVKEMRNEFMAGLSCKAKRKSKMEFQIMRDIGMMDSNSSSDFQQNISIPKDAELEVRTKEKSKSSETVIDTFDGVKPIPVSANSQGNEIQQLINEINIFTIHMDRDPDSVDWDAFRTNLFMIHKYYVNSESNNSSSSSEDNPPVTDLNVCIQRPSKALYSQSKHIRSHKRDLDRQMHTLNNTFQEFCDNFSRHSISKHRVEHDIKILGMLREEIDQKLNQMEVEFIKAKNKRIYRAKSNSYVQQH